MSPSPTAARASSIVRILEKATLNSVGPEVGRRRLLRASMRSPWSVAAVVLVAYAFWLLAFFGSGHEPRDMIYIGRQFVTQSHASQVIRLDPSYPNVSEIGYDGQFFYYLALDPADVGVGRVQPDDLAGVALG